MAQQQPQDELPKWFRMISKIANHFSYGLIVLFYLINMDWSVKHFNSSLIGWVNVFLVILGVPTGIFSGANIFSTLFKIIGMLKK